MLIIVSCSSFAIEDYANSEGLTLNFKISSNINIEKTISNAYLEDVTVKVNYELKNNSNQIIDSLQSTPKSVESDAFSFIWKTPKETPLSFEINSIIKTNGDYVKVKDKVNFPITNYDKDIYEYTRPTKMIDLNDDILALSSSLSQGKTDLYEVVFAYAVWANNNVEYDLSSIAADAVEPSSWVLKNKRGVCDEITNLFISLCRAQGIPARFVSGVSFTNSDKFSTPWGPHGWAEVYFPNVGWVPVDPTYGEIGFVDAGHIKLNDGYDSEKTGIEYSWKGKNVELTSDKMEYNVDVVNAKTDKSEVLDISVSPYSSNVDFGSYNYIKAQVKNNNDYYVTSKIYLSVPREIEIDGEKEIFVLLPPNSEKNYFFIIKVPTDLKKDYKYTFPSSIVTQLNSTISTEFYSEYKKRFIDYETIKKLILEGESKTDDNQLFFCKSNNLEINKNENIFVSCVFENKLDSQINSLEICLDKDCKTSNILPKSSNVFNFTLKFDTDGSKLLKATASNNEILKDYYFTLFVLDKPTIEITDINYPLSVGYEDKFNIDFKVSKTSYATPKNAKVGVFYNKNKESWDVNEIDKIIPFSIELEGKYLKNGKNDMKIRVEYSDDAGESYFSEIPFNISLDNLTFGQKIMVYLNQFSLWIDRKMKG